MRVTVCIVLHGTMIFLPAGFREITFSAPLRSILPVIKLSSNEGHDGHDELCHRAKFGEDRTTRTGCRCENVVFVTGSIAAKRQTPPY